MPAALIQKLEALGYRFEVDGDTIRYCRVFKAGTEDPKLLLLALKARKAEALAYLRRRQEPHPGDCVCPDCLHPGQETPLAGALLPGAHPGPAPAPLDLPASLRPDGTCWACGGARWWVSVHGVLACGTCHPPAVPELVARWVEAEEAAGLKKAARADAGPRGSIPRGIMEASGYETRPWIPGREIEWLWDNTRLAKCRLTPVQEYARGRIAGTIPPPDPGPPEEPFRYALPDGIPDPMDFRWDDERQEWVHAPGWWRRISRRERAH